MTVTVVLAVLVCMTGLFLLLLAAHPAIRQFAAAMLCAGMLALLLSVMRVV